MLKSSTEGKTEAERWMVGEESSLLSLLDPDVLGSQGPGGTQSCSFVWAGQLRPTTFLSFMSPGPSSVPGETVAPAGILLTT